MTKPDEAAAEEVTPEQGREIFRNRCREVLGVEPEEFLRYGPISAPERWGHERVAEVLILLPFWTPERSTDAG